MAFLLADILNIFSGPPRSKSLFLNGFCAFLFFSYGSILKFNSKYSCSCVLVNTCVSHNSEAARIYCPGCKFVVVECAGLVVG